MLEVDYNITAPLLKTGNLLGLNYGIRSCLYVVSIQCLMVGHLGTNKREIIIIAATNQIYPGKRRNRKLEAGGKLTSSL